MTPKTIAYSRIIDLSHPIHPEIPLWAGDPAVEFETTALIEQHGYYLRRFSMGEHSGTHMNAPNSFFADGVGIDTYQAESLVLTAVAIDIQQKAVADADYTLADHDLEAWEQQHGKIPVGAVVLLCTGWHTKWTTPTEFWNLDSEGIPHFPSFSLEVTRFLLQERAIAGIGIDTHGVDSPQDATFAVNRQVLSQQGIVLENLTNLGQLPATGTTLVIGVPKLLGGSGAPVAVLAFIP